MTSEFTQVSKPEEAGSLKYLLPFVLLSLASILVGLAQARLFLRTTGEEVNNTLRYGNYLEAQGLETATLVARLNALLETPSWQCVRLESRAKVLFERTKGSCRDSFFREQIVVEQGDLRILVTVSLPSPALEVTGLFVLLQAVLFAFGAFFSQRLSQQKVIEARNIELAMIRQASQVAHDIRSPLAALETIVKVVKLPEDQKNLVSNAVARVREIASDLLGKRRISAGETHLERTRTFRIGLAMRDVVAEKTMQYQSKSDLSLSLDLPESLFDVEVRGEPAIFKRVISNLINNSVEALVGERTGQIAVTVSESSNRLAIEVSIRDNGCGMDTDLLSKLGTRGLSRGKEGGFGLGLAHAQASLKAWDSKLVIDSKPGEGTTVRCALLKASPI